MEPIRVALVGCGRWGANLARNLASLDRFRLVAVCDVDSARAAALGDRWNVPARHAGHRDLLRREPLDAVVVATPAQSHHCISADAIDAGLHVLVEKPLALSAREAEDLATRARRRGVALMADHTELHDGTVREAIARARAGEAGDIVLIAMEHLNRGDGPPDLDLPWDLAPHDLAILDAIVGAEPAAIRAAPGPDGPERSARILVRYPGGERAEIVLWRGAPARRRSLAIHGTAGVIEAPDLGDGAPLRVTLRDAADGGGPVAFEVACDRVEPLARLCLEFASLVRGGPAFDDAGRAVRVVRAIDALGIRHGGTEDTEVEITAPDHRECPPGGWPVAQGRRADPTGG